MPKILYIQYANPAAFPPIEYSSRILADCGWKVRFIGVHSHGSELLSFPKHPNIETEILSQTKPGFRQKIAYMRFIFHCVSVAKRWNPGWVYVSDSLAAPAGLLLSRLGFNVIYHEHDSPGPYQNATKFMKFVLWARKALARKACFNILPQRERLKLFVQETGTTQPTLCVWNCSQKGEATKNCNRLRKAKQALGVYFHGSINLNMVPLTLIEGAALSGVPIKIRIVGYETIGSIGAIDRLKAAAKPFQELVTLEFPGSVSRHELRNFMDEMHVGWVNLMNKEQINLRYLVGASNKAFDYLAAGLAIIVPDQQDWVDFFNGTECAISCDSNDPNSIAKTLRWLHENPEVVAQMGEKGRKQVRETWNYETQFAPVKELLLAKQ
jgi:glycosyltransferase involved in cell wall biosynthesis